MDIKRICKTTHDAFSLTHFLKEELYLWVVTPVMIFSRLFKQQILLDWGILCSKILVLKKEGIAVHLIGIPIKPLEAEPVHIEELQEQLVNSM